MKQYCKSLFIAIKNTTALIPIDVVILILFYKIYSIIRNLILGNEYIADNNARILTKTEAILHINVEESINHIVNRGYTIPMLMSYFYIIGHFIITIIVYAFIYTFMKDIYRKQRFLLILSTSICLLGYYFFPLSPPRLWVWSNFVDTISILHPFNSYTYHSPITTNQYAAMPSMHIIWALWVSSSLIQIAAHFSSRNVLSRCIRIIGYLYPIITLIVIIATGNHIILDAAGGGIVFYTSKKILDKCMRQNSYSIY